MTTPENEVSFVFEMTSCDFSGGLLQKKKFTVSAHTASSLSENLLNSGVVKPQSSKELNSGGEIKFSVWSG